MNKFAGRKLYMYKKIFNSEFPENSKKKNNSQIENQTFSPTETLYGHTRVFINLTSPLIAILAAPFETKISLFFLLASVIINLIPGFIALILRTTKLDQKLTPLIKQPHFAPNSEVSISDKG